LSQNPMGLRLVGIVTTFTLPEIITPEQSRTVYESIGSGVDRQMAVFED
jgi:hypothetical protein